MNENQPTYKIRIYGMNSKILYWFSSHQNLPSPTGEFLLYHDIDGTTVMFNRNVIQHIEIEPMNSEVGE